MVPAAVPAPVLIPEPALLSPADNYANIVSMGVYKASKPAGQIFVLGIQAGFYIALSGMIYLALGGNMPGIAASNPGLHKVMMEVHFF